MHERYLIRNYEEALSALQSSSRDPASPAADTKSATIANIQQLEEEEARLLNEISLSHVPESERAM